MIIFVPIKNYQGVLMKTRYECEYFYVDDGDGFACCDCRGNDKGICNELECPLKNKRRF